VQMVYMGLSNPSYDQVFGRITAGQRGWAARESNPEPTD
jgi:hypothetical protein